MWSPKRDRWRLVRYQRNYRHLGYRRPYGTGSADPTALGDVPADPGQLSSVRTATHYVELAQPGTFERKGKLVQAPFRGVLDAMFAVSDDARHQLPGESEALSLLDTLRR